MSFSSQGCNLDCIHPAESVLDFLCGPNCMTYAAQLESFFDAYADMRGIKSKMFKPLKSCVWSLDSPAFIRNNSNHQKPCFFRIMIIKNICWRPLPNWMYTGPASQTIDASSSDDTLKLPLTCLKRLGWLKLLGFISLWPWAYIFLGVNSTILFGTLFDKNMVHPSHKQLFNKMNTHPIILTNFPGQRLWF